MVPDAPVPLTPHDRRPRATPSTPGRRPSCPAPDGDRRRDELVVTLVPVVRAVVAHELVRSPLCTIGTRLTAVGINALVGAIETYVPRAGHSLESHVRELVAAAVARDSARLHAGHRGARRVDGRSRPTPLSR